MATIKVEDLTFKHLNTEITLITPFERITGILTDFYGSLDEDDEAIVIIEINEEPYVCLDDPDIEI